MTSDEKKLVALLKKSQFGCSNSIPVLDEITETLYDEALVQAVLVLVAYEIPNNLLY